MSGKANGSITEPRRTPTRLSRARATWLVALMACLGAAMTGIALGVPGDLDLSFGTDGKRIIDYGGSDFAKDIALGPNGRIVVVGAGNPLSDVAVQVLLPDGSGDPSFDAEGSLGIPFNGIDVGNAVAIQPDGKILVAGSTRVIAAAQADLIVMRLNPDGSLDTSFDGDGKRIIDYGGEDFAEDIALRADGRIVIVGAGNPLSDVAVQVLLPDGSGDPSFDAEGSLGIPLDGTDRGNAVAIQPDGKILVAGTTRPGGGGETNLVVLRVNLDGSLDPSFDGDGKRIINYGGEDSATDVALRSDGRIVVVGNGTGSDNVVIQALLPNGSDDSSVYLNGVLEINLGGFDLGNAVALQTDGKILVAATGAGGPFPGKFTVLRVQPGGALDTTFSGGGRRIIDFGTGSNANAIALQRDGRILAAGSAGDNNFNLAIARLQGDPQPAGGGPGGGAGETPGGSGPGGWGSCAVRAGRRRSSARPPVTACAARAVAT